MNWYYADQGHQAGPVEGGALDELVRSGALPASALVWHEGMAGWTPYSTARRIQPPAVQPIQVPVLDFSQRAGTCISCGRAVSPQESTVVGRNTVCPECKPVFVERLREGDLTTLPGALPYAGFWTRYAARMTDYTAVNFAQAAFTGLLLAWFLRGKQVQGAEVTNAFTATAIGTLGGFVMRGAYEVYFLATRGATPGKMLYYLRVVNPSGGRIDTGNAFGRYFAEMLDMMTGGIGWLMAGFDVEKRALHDRVAGTRVIQDQPAASDLTPIDREIRCESCKTPLPEAEWNSPGPVPCPGCNQPVQAVVFRSIARALPSGVPEVKSGESEAGCYYHDGNRATTTCEECGRFLCAVCDLDAGPRRLCPSCFNGCLTTPEFVQRRTMYDSIALTLALVPNLLIFTIYFTVFTAPAVVGFTIWSWKKPGAVTYRTKWRFMVALVIASINILFIGIFLVVLLFGALK
jgi:uncharacterized RDD family membrane protein YckC